MDRVISVVVKVSEDGTNTIVSSSIVVDGELVKVLTDEDLEVSVFDLVADFFPTEVPVVEMTQAEFLETFYPNPRPEIEREGDGWEDEDDLEDV